MCIKQEAFTIEGLPDIKLSEHGYFGDLVAGGCISFSDIYFCSQGLGFGVVLGLGFRA